MPDQTAQGHMCLTLRAVGVTFLIEDAAAAGTAFRLPVAASKESRRCDYGYCWMAFSYCSATLSQSTTSKKPSMKLPRSGP